MDLVDRLYHRLAQAIEPGPDGTDTATTVGEIYQRLIPYRAMRNELGVWELSEYEHGLVRLLSGERDYLAIDPSVQEELRREIASPNPILGIYRDYSAIPVRVRPPTASAVAAAAGSIPPIEEPSPSPPEQPTSASTAHTEEPPAKAAGGPTEADCSACNAPLPAIEGLRFCPNCGSDQLEAPCRACGTRLRPEWNFCIRCGTKKSEERGARRERG